METPGKTAMPKVLFICLGNSCRSIMAEALARHLLRPGLQAASAGINPLGFIAPGTLEALAEMGIDGSGLRSKGLAEIDFREVSLIVNLTLYPLGPLVLPAFQGRLLHRPVLDPYGGGPELYRRTRDALARLITGELAQLLLPPSP